MNFRHLALTSSTLDPNTLTSTPPFATTPGPIFYVSVTLPYETRRKSHRNLPVLTVKILPLQSTSCEVVSGKLEQNTVRCLSKDTTPLSSHLLTIFYTPKIKLI